MRTHRCRFVEFNPAGISSLSFSSDAVLKSVRLACARDNGDIEIWHPSANWLLEKTIRGSPEHAIESVCWLADASIAGKVHNRLFSSGLDGTIREWDLNSLTCKHATPSNGGAIWCMAVSPNQKQIAIGCEDGCIRIFNIIPLDDMPFYNDVDFKMPTMEYSHSLEKIDARILSVSWHPSGNTLVSGSSDGCIRKMDVKTGRVLQRYKVNRYGKKETLVWSLLYLNDSTFVSGDSSGRVSLWDHKTGTLIQSSKSHKADVLCLAAAQSGSTVFSASIDRSIVRHQLVESKDSQKSKWIHAGERRYHSHDVRALAVLDCHPVTALVSGGVDTTLIVASPLKSYPQGTELYRMSPFPQQPIVQLADKANLLLVRFDHLVQVWQLGQVASEESLQRPHQLLAEIKPTCQSNLVSAAISSNGQFIALSDAHQTKLFHMVFEDSSEDMPPTIIKVPELPEDLPAAQQIAFSPDSRWMFVAGINAKIYVLDLQNSLHVAAVFDHHIQLTPEDTPARVTITQLTISADGAWLASGDDKNRINIFNLDTLRYHTTVPVLSTQHVAMAFNPERGNELAVATSSNAFFIYDVDAKAMTPWSRDNTHKIPEKFLARKESIKGLFYITTRLLMIWATTYVAIIDLTKPINEQTVRINETFAETQKPAHKLPSAKSMNLNLSHRFDSALFMGVNAQNEMVVVERPLLKMMEALPPSFYQKTYGS